MGSSDRNYPSVRIKNFGHDEVLMCGSFSVTPAGGPIVANSRFGDGWTVAYTGVGRYTVTTNDTYRHVVDCGGHFVMTTPTDTFVCSLPPGGGAGAAVTLELRLWNATAAAAVDPAAATDEIHFWMILSNSQLDRAAW